VVGYYDESSLEQLPEHSAFYWNDSASSMVTLSGKVHDAYAMAINDAGKIAGHYFAFLHCNGMNKMPVTWENGYAQSVALFCPAAGTGGVLIEDINEAGTVIGHMTSYPDYLWRAFTWNGTKTEVPLLACQSYANGINESGAVAGTSEDCDGFNQLAFYWNGSSATSVSLGTFPGGTRSQAMDVNDDAFVAGRSNTSEFPLGSRAFLWHAHFGMIELPIPKGFPYATLCRANALNNRNPVNGYIQAVGFCTNSSGSPRPVRWTIKVDKTPIP
jgi:uncharacterized membrane protein